MYPYPDQFGNLNYGNTNIPDPNFYNNAQQVTNWATNISNNIINSINPVAAVNTAIINYPGTGINTMWGNSYAAYPSYRDQSFRQGETPPHFSNNNSIMRSDGPFFQSRDGTFKLKISYNTTESKELGYEAQGSIRLTKANLNDGTLKKHYLGKWTDEVLKPAQAELNRKFGGRSLSNGKYEGGIGQMIVRLTELDLSQNQIGDMGIQDLVEWMSQWRMGAEIIKLYKNHCGDWSMICLAAYLEDSGKSGMAVVRELHLSDCFMTRVGFRELLQALVSNISYPEMKEHNRLQWITPIWVRADNNLIEDPVNYLRQLQLRDVKWENDTGNNGGAASGGLRGIRRAVMSGFCAPDLFVNFQQKNYSNENFKGYRCLNADKKQFPVGHLLFLQKQRSARSITVPPNASLINSKTYHFKIRPWASPCEKWGKHGFVPTELQVSGKANSPSHTTAASKMQIFSNNSVTYSSVKPMLTGSSSSTNNNSSTIPNTGGIRVYSSTASNQNTNNASSSSTAKTGTVNPNGPFNLLGPSTGNNGNITDRSARSGSSAARNRSRSRKRDDANENLNRSIFQRLDASNVVPNVAIAKGSSIATSSKQSLLSSSIDQNSKDNNIQPVNTKEQKILAEKAAKNKLMASMNAIKNKNNPFGGDGDEDIYNSSSDQNDLQSALNSAMGLGGDSNDGALNGLNTSKNQDTEADMYDDDDDIPITQMGVSGPNAGKEELLLKLEQELETLRKQAVTEELNTRVSPKVSPKLGAAGGKGVGKGVAGPGVKLPPPGKTGTAGGKTGVNKIPGAKQPGVKARPGAKSSPKGSGSPRGNALTGAGNGKGGKGPTAKSSEPAVKKNNPFDDDDDNYGGDDELLIESAKEHEGMSNDELKKLVAEYQMN